MVFKVDPQPEQEMAAMVRQLARDQSTCLRQDAGGPCLHLWRCPAEPPGAIAYWIGDADKCVAYIGFYPTTLGDQVVLEGKRAWTDSGYRGRGLAKALLRAAAADRPLVTDRGGMTEDGFRLWMSVSDLEQRWWNCDRSMFVPEADVPERDRFTRWEQEGQRYQVVLSPPSTAPA